MTVSTFYPDGNPESTSVDGYTIWDDGAGATWTTARTNAATSANDVAGVILCHVSADDATDKYDGFRRGDFLFDTSALPDGDIISIATLGFVTQSIKDEIEPEQSVDIVSCDPASDTAIATGDHVLSKFGSDLFATGILMTAWVNDQATYNTYTFNATGIAAVNKTGISKFGMMISCDRSNTEPTWGNHDTAEVIAATAEETYSGDKRPKLIVTHISPFTPKAIMF